MSNKSRARTKNDLILEVWAQLDCESVGVGELEQIQKAISERFGAGAVDSPASIARLLADEGAALRHPEVLDADTAWRQNGLASYREMDFATLSGATIAIKKLESLRKDLLGKDDQVELTRIYEFVREVRVELSLVGHSKPASDSACKEAKEIIEWLSVWRRSPDLFADWLELRLISKGFVELFPDFFPSN